MPVRVGEKGLVGPPKTSQKLRVSSYDGRQYDEEVAPSRVFELRWQWLVQKGMKEASKDQFYENLKDLVKKILRLIKWSIMKYKYLNIITSLEYELERDSS
jgi:hypothetical protein